MGPNNSIGDGGNWGETSRGVGTAVLQKEHGQISGFIYLMVSVFEI